MVSWINLSWHVYQLQKKLLHETNNATLLLYSHLYVHNLQVKTFNRMEELRSTFCRVIHSLVAKVEKAAAFWLIKTFENLAFGGSTILAVWPDLAIYWTLSNFLKPLATMHLPKSPTFWGNFCKGVKIFNISREIIFRQLFRNLAIFFWSHWILGTLLNVSAKW